MVEELIQKECPVCGIYSNPSFTSKDWNRGVSPRDFEYRKCSKCGLIFLADMPLDLNSFYGDSYYLKPKFDRLKKVAKAESYQLGMISRFVRGGRLLEVGPGFGVFAYQAKQAGFDVTVIEKEERCCRFLAEHVGVNAIRSDSPQNVLKSEQGYDVIALWHVIEHLPCLLEFLEIAAKKLNPNGVLLIATPNPGAFQFKLQGEQWPHVDAPRHLWLIPVELLINYLEPLGLAPVMLTSNDKGARSWNKFGWQRYLMNKSRNRWFQAVTFVMGYLVSLIMHFFETCEGNGSAYTIILRKRA